MNNACIYLLSIFSSFEDGLQNITEIKEINGKYEIEVPDWKELQGVYDYYEKIYEKINRSKEAQEYYEKNYPKNRKFQKRLLITN